MKYFIELFPQVPSQSYNNQRLMCFYLRNIIAGWDQEEMYLYVLSPSAFQRGFVVLEAVFCVFCGFINRLLLKKQETRPLANPGVTVHALWGWGRHS